MRQEFRARRFSYQSGSYQVTERTGMQVTAAMIIGDNMIFYKEKEVYSR